MPSACLAVLLLLPFGARAQTVNIPNCNIDASSNFCQHQCFFDKNLPWCERLDPVVLVPPMLASYNKKLMKEDQGGGPWRYAYGGNVFKGLMKKLETAGYEEGENLFVAHYDWRNSNKLSSRLYLKPIIDHAKEATGFDKVDIVAHSMGGLVARSYVQGPSYDEDVDQLITLGTPHGGAADAYVAWEGGQLPQRWNSFMRYHISSVEDSLREVRGVSGLERPLSLRALFPFLRELIPTDVFVRSDGEDVDTEELTDPNEYLAELNAGSHLIEGRGVRLTAIGSANLETLENVLLKSERNSTDVALERWRDGHPSVEPIPADSTVGDETVTLASAHLGDDTRLLFNVKHIDLPGAAQDIVFDALGLEPENEADRGKRFASNLPEHSVAGVTILSPISAEVRGPNGEILNATTNTFGEDVAEYDDDPNDPDDPIDINFADMPEGDYTITYTGTGDGEYTIITSYADEDEVVSNVRDGVTTLGQVFTDSFTVTEDTTTIIDD